MSKLAMKRLPLGVGLLILFTGSLALAQPTVEDVRAATAAGVAWLAAVQNPDGSWECWEQCAITAMAVKKLMHHAVDPTWGLGLSSPFDEANPYRANVVAGLNYLFTHCVSTIPISAQPAGDPDSDGDGIGVYADSYHPTYSTGIALMTVCEAVELDRVVEAGPLSGWTYEDVARDMMDYLAFGQNDANWERGGWGYTHNYVGFSDNSNSGYVALGLGFAGAPPPAGCGFSLPQFVKDELNIWIDYIQNDVDGDVNDGGSGYTDPNNWVNTLKTGTLLQQLALVGDDSTSTRVQDALDYLERHWADPNSDPGWVGDSGVANYQATFNMMKGFQSLGIEEFGVAPINWAVDFETALVAQQNPVGYWPLTYWDYGCENVLSTTWALLTLQRAAPPPPVIQVAVDVKPTSCRNPFNIGKEGVLPVAILGTETFDVRHIDVLTVQLEGVMPIRSGYEDVATPFVPFVGKQDAFDCTEEGPDGFEDLTLKFEATEVAAALGAVNDGDVLVLHLTGSLQEEYGGTAIVGEDVVVILKKGK